MNERIVYAPRTLRWSWSGVSFAAAGGAVSVDAASRVEGENWWRTETLSYGEMNSLIDDGPVDVLLTHDAPEESGIANFAKSDPKSEGHRRGISALMEACTPRLLVHGHYHHNHDSVLTHAAGQTRVLGLGMNQRPENDRGDGYAVLTLPSLTLG